MKTIKQAIVGTVIILSLNSFVPAFAVPGLQISVQSSNAVIFWPTISGSGETYLVQFRHTLDASTPWMTLTDNFPAALGTNVTFYIHSNIVQYPPVPASSGTNLDISPPGSDGTNETMSYSTATTGTASAVPTFVEPVDGSSGPLPIAIYPPGFDLYGYLVYYPSLNEWMSGNGYTVPDNSANAVQTSEIQPMDDSGGDTNYYTGFYRVERDLSSLGTNFWVAFPSVVNYPSYPGVQLSLFISSPSATAGTVTVLGLTNFFTVTFGQVTNIVIPVGAMMTTFDAIGTNAIEITASSPVCIYAMDYCWVASTAFTCYPVPMLGTNYCVMARSSHASGYAVSNYSEFAIIATADNTTVTIIPSPTAGLVGHAGTNAYTETLQQGETYQIKSSNDAGDVTGTVITSDKPTAVFAGDSDADVPDGNTAAANPLVQEQLPVEQWGMQALSVGFGERKRGDMYRVLAAYSSTLITATGTNGVLLTTNLAAGQFCDAELAGPVEFQASEPIQVAHFANGIDYDNALGADPCEIFLPPTGRYLVTNTIFTLDNVTEDFGTNMLNLIVPQSAIADTLVDGSTVAATNFVAIGTSGYYGAQIGVTNSGAHTITSSQPVGVEVYGFGWCDAYGYFGGIVK